MSRSPQPAAAKQRPEAEYYPDADKRRDDTIRRMLATPPNAPRGKPAAKKPRTAQKAAKPKVKR